LEKGKEVQVSGFDSDDSQYVNFFIQSEVIDFKPFFLFILTSTLDHIEIGDS